MGPLTLNRIKTEDIVSYNAWHSRINFVKQENIETNIKAEPGTDNITLQVKFISSPDIKSINILTNKSEQELETKKKTNRRKRKLSSSLPVPRRPQFPLAVRVHKYLIAKDPNTLSKKELDSLTWAESIIVRRILRSIQETQTKEEPVLVKNPLNASFLKAEFKSEYFIPNTLQLEIIDCGSPDRKYNFERGKLIEREFNKAVVDHILSKSLQPTPTFGLTSWRNGVLILDCKDTSSYEFARVTVNKMTPWKCAKLKAIPFQGDNMIYIAKFHAPDIDIEKKDLIKVLESQNPRINVKNWKVIEERTSYPGLKTYYLAISQPPVTFLQNKYLKLVFGASEVVLEFINTENLT